MSGARAIAMGAVSGLGFGREAFDPGAVGAPPRIALAHDDALGSAGLARPFAARAPRELEIVSGDPATDLLVRALGDATRELDQVRPGWRAERVGVAVGTSSGGMASAERFFAARAAGASINPALARAATYFAPLDEALSRLGLADVVVRRTQVLAACAASAFALGIGLRWLERGACDVVLAGGYDAVTLFVASGFEVLRATTATRPRPFRLGRDGMSLGEGAAVVALVREADAGDTRAWMHLAGFGASTDAVHITAPDRTGAGLHRAAIAALEDAATPARAVGLVSAHATATPFNDAMEARAIAATFASAPTPVVHPFKAQIGHTLGAAGVLEALAAADAIARQVAPGAAGEGAIDPDAKVDLLEASAPRTLGAALKLAAAFGGSNAALILSASASSRPPRPPRPVWIGAAAEAGDVSLEALSAGTGIARDRLARLDTLCRLGLAAVIALAAKVGGRDALAGAGVVAGHALATLETNAAFHARLVARGPRLADPRLFPATSPNALAGECAIAFGLTGPGLSVGAGLDGGAEALAIAAELVASGAADRIVVVAADDLGPVSRDLIAAAGWSDRAAASGAIAALLEALPRPGAASVSADLAFDHRAGPVGHLGLRARLQSV